MDRAIFGTDGIRGPAYVYPLDETGAFQVGKAVASYFAKFGDCILIGRDPRESSAMLEAAVADGIASMGVEVRLLGILPTPGLAFLTHQVGACAGVMITASHNPYTDNGIKVFSAEGTKLPDDVEAKLNTLISSTIDDYNQPKADINNCESLVKDYENFLVASAGETLFTEHTIALDSANGATSYIARKVFTRLKAQVIPLFNKPDGRNINDHCGATDTTALQETVKSQHLDVGIAFDGDGDRVIVIDEKGRALSGDHILYILALARHEPGVVATLMSNMGFEKALNTHNIELKRTAVGDRYVLEGLQETGYKLGGEQSGHIIMTDFYTTGDGLLAAVQVLKCVAASGISLSDWFDQISIWPQALVNIPTNDKAVIQNLKVQKFINEHTNALGQTGRLNIRPSGTEPLLRVMLEAPDAKAKAELIAADLTSLIASIESESK